MTSRQKLEQVGFPFPSEKKMQIFRKRIQHMLARDQSQTTPELFSSQYMYESFLKGGPKHLRALSFHIENQLKAPDGFTTERYKNKQRERIYRDLKRWCEAAGIDSSLVESGQFLFHRLRRNAARLHSPLTVAVICVLLCEEQLRKEQEEREVVVYPPSKVIRMNYGKTSRQKWIEFLEKETYGEIQSHDERPQSCKSACSPETFNPYHW